MRTLRSRSRTQVVVGCITVLVVLGGMASAAILLTSNQYDVVIATVQALAVIPAIAVAALAIVNDSHGKRVDRVLEMHKEFNSTEMQLAKNRLRAHLRRHGADGHARPTSREELQHDKKLSEYSLHRDFSPGADVALIFRFFERVNAARIANIVDMPLLVELIGRHATWWNLAIKDSGEDEVPRAPLRELAQWADEFALSHQHQYSYLRNWGKNRKREFGDSGNVLSQD